MPTKKYNTGFYFFDGKEFKPISQIEDHSQDHELEEAIAGLYEMYNLMIKTGFTREEAMTFLLGTIKGMKDEVER